MALRNCSAFSAHSFVVRTHFPLFSFSTSRSHFSLSVSVKQSPQAANDDTRSVGVGVGERAEQSLCVSKRELSLSILAVLLNGCLPTRALAQDVELERYVDARAGFTLLRPSSWIQVEKAGATVLFEEPNRGSNNVGVVVSPVRLSSLGEFGTPEFVADKLIQAERRKESTKEAEVIGVAERSGHGGLQVYEFEYKVDSTRGGMKRIFSAAFVASKKLYLLNIAYSDKPESPLDAQTRASLEEVLHSFDSAALS